MMRVMRTASSNFPGTAAYPGASRCTSTGAKIIPSAHTTPTTMMIALATRFARRAACGLSRVER